MPRALPSIESFGPRLVQVWIEAATRRVDLPCKTKSEAIRLRQRLYSLRKVLAANGHEAYRTAQHATIKLIQVDNNGACALVIEPAGTEFERVLDNAGINLPMPELPDIDFGGND